MANVNKRTILEALMKLNITEDIQVGDVVVTPADITETLEKSIQQLDAKAVKAKERAQAKKVEGDQLRDSIEAVLGTEPMTITEIVDALNDDSITPAKVTARLTQLYNLGKIDKTDVKAGDRKLKGYFLATTSTADAE